MARRRYIAPFVVLAATAPVVGCWIVAGIEDRPVADDVGDAGGGREDAALDAPSDAFRCDDARADPACKAVVIATGQTTPLDVAVDAVNVYWTTYVAGRVLQCPKSGCDVGGPILVAKPPAASTPVTIALDRTGVYWGDQDRIGLGIRRPDGGVESLLSGQVAGIAFAGSELFCSRFDYRDAGYAQGIYHGAAGSPPTLLRVDKRPLNLVVRDSYLYFAAHGTGGPFGRCLLPSCVSVDTYHPDVGVNNFVLRGNQIYTTYNSGVSWCQLENQGADCILRDLALSKDVQGIAADDSFVYWASHDDGIVARCPIPSITSPPCVPSIIASGQSPWGLAIDDDYVYWANTPPGDAPGAGSIARAHK